MFACAHILNIRSNTALAFRRMKHSWSCKLEYRFEKSNDAKAVCHICTRKLTVLKTLRLLRQNVRGGELEPRRLMVTFCVFGWPKKAGCLRVVCYATYSVIFMVAARRFVAVIQSSSLLPFLALSSNNVGLWVQLKKTSYTMVKTSLTILIEFFQSGSSTLSGRSCPSSQKSRRPTEKCHSTKRYYGQPSLSLSSWSALKYHCMASCRRTRPILCTGCGSSWLQTEVPWWSSV